MAALNPIPPIHITVNGAPRALPRGSTIADLLRLLDVATPLVAVERNRVIVPRRHHGTTEVEDGDVLEVVTLVGGG